MKYTDYRLYAIESRPWKIGQGHRKQIQLGPALSKPVGKHFDHLGTFRKLNLFFYNREK